MTLKLNRLMAGTGALAAAAAGVVALAGPVSGASGAKVAKVAKATSEIYVASEGCTGHVYKPTKVTLACADDNIYATGLKFSSYGGSTAKATGTIHANECKPNCAAGKFKTYKAKLTFLDVVQCSDGRSYYGSVNYEINKSNKGTADIEPLSKLKCKASS